MEKKAILLVDDERDYHLIVSAQIEKAGLAFVGARDAPAAFQALRGNEFGLILLDIEMPGINGFRGLTHIRSAAEWTRAVPVIAFTSLRPADGEAHFRQRGFDGWLPKPFDPRDIASLLERWLGVTAG